MSEEKRIFTFDAPKHDQTIKTRNFPHVATNQQAGEHAHAYDIRPAIAHDYNTLIISRNDGKSPGASYMRDRKGTTRRVTILTGKKTAKKLL